ncbi:hypothetical protein P7K49_032291 [Saguinus oedipus]|uniref:Uncharacterized protein n=1 Tax=Saguinus oedipus TaxID=9490 RepID=A0ABQ9TYN6_SAGOE|nr:hypothetical protein P7K49_032291 [Saguinus oedipus]
MNCHLAPRACSSLPPPTTPCSGSIFHLPPLPLLPFLPSASGNNRFYPSQVKGNRRESLPQDGTGSRSGCVAGLWGVRLSLHPQRAKRGDLQTNNHLEEMPRDITKRKAEGCRVDGQLSKEAWPVHSRRKGSMFRKNRTSALETELADGQKEQKTLNFKGSDSSEHRYEGGKESLPRRAMGPSQTGTDANICLEEFSLHLMQPSLPRVTSSLKGNSSLQGLFIKQPSPPAPRPALLPGDKCVI